MHFDPAFDLLLPNLRDNEGPNLWVVDENVSPYLAGLLEGASIFPKDLQILTNRYEVNEQFKSFGMTSTFNDFDFDALPLDRFKNIFYRVSKEKPVVHRIINQALQHLEPAGSFYLAGAKKEGIQSYLTKSAHLTTTKLQKIRGKQQSTVGILTLPSDQDTNAPIKQLDDKHYTECREISQHYFRGPFQGPEPLQPQEEPLKESQQKSISLHSKPGVFCWDRIDPGSLFLSQHFEEFLNSDQFNPNSCLDLGCGYGFLATMASQYAIKEITATDNNAAALKACQVNFDLNGISGKVVAANCGQSIHKKFDLVLCNPPFHHGFKTDPALTQHFLGNAKRLMAKKGKALFVVNQFIPLEKLARNHFKKCTELANDNSFKLFILE